MKRLITDYLDENANLYPEKVVFSDENETVSFFELRKRALTIAKAIIDKEISQQLVVLFFEKNIKCICSMLGVLYSGNYYSVIDASAPEKYIERVIKKADPALVIAESSFKREVGENSNKSLIYEKIMESGEIANDYVIKEALRCISENSVYSICFTSGSSGIPKGVVHSHRSLITNMLTMYDAFGHSENTVFGNQFPFISAGSTEDIYISILCRCETQIIPNKLFSNPYALAKYISDRKVNSLYWVTSAIHLCTEYKVFEQVKGLKFVKFAGEKIPVNTLNRLRNYLPNVKIVNQFGSTEVYCASYQTIDRDYSEEEKIPIGITYEGVEAIVIGDDGEKSDKGELYIKSPHIAGSYYRDNELTSDAFVQNPLHDLYTDIVFRTGDIVQISGNRVLYYLGRRDNQIKRHGRRIEMEEIEGSAGFVKGVEEVGCAYNADKQLVFLFYTGEISEIDLSVELRNRLPNYYLPDRYVKLEKMPHNTTGKVDRNALKASAV